MYCSKALNAHGLWPDMAYASNPEHRRASDLVSPVALHSEKHKLLHRISLASFQGQDVEFCKGLSAAARTAGQHSGCSTAWPPCTCTPALGCVLGCYQLASRRCLLWRCTTVAPCRQGECGTRACTVA